MLRGRLWLGLHPAVLFGKHLFLEFEKSADPEPVASDLPENGPVRSAGDVEHGGDGGPAQLGSRDVALEELGSEKLEGQETEGISAVEPVAEIPVATEKEPREEKRADYLQHGLRRAAVP